MSSSMSGYYSTLFVPASIAYVNVVKARFVEVDPDNKYYKYKAEAEDAVTHAMAALMVNILCIVV
mgnify:CR=1 FL=1